MYAIYVLSCVITMISAAALVLTVFCSLVNDMYKSISEIILSIVFLVILIAGAIGISNTYNSPEVVRNSYLDKVNHVMDAENDLEKFLITHPEFKDGNQ